MIHLDLFSGIGGFAYAIDQLWDNAKHIFCDNDKFCQQVLKMHWPNSKIYGDIRTITNTESWQSREQTEQERRKDFSGRNCIDTDTNRNGLQIKGAKLQASGDRQFPQIDILTGGFPCQPFSQAGKRRGTEDNRYLWPEMLRVIQLAKPQWVIAENVRGLLTQQGGLVFQQVCLDLEALNYEVQPFIIPAIAKNAPHRRDRVWFVAYNTSEGLQRNGRKKKGFTFKNRNVKNTLGERSRRRLESGGQVLECQSSETENERPNWERNWLEVATELCRMDDGLSTELDFAGWTKARHRVERLKSLGNSIVPQVAMEILKAIKLYY